MAGLSKLLLVLWRWGRRFAAVVASVLGVYACYLLIGLAPVNRGFVPSSEGPLIAIASSSVHTDFVLPMVTDEWDWRERFPARHFDGDTDWATHVAIGWGDRGFYLDTPTWADLKASTAATAMFAPSGSVMHVVCTSEPPEIPSITRVRISPDQYRRLCEAIEASFAVDAEGRSQRIKGESYSQFDAFYEGRGAYHCFNTCNSWAGRQLKEAGVSAPLFTPLPHQPAMYLPDAE